MARCLPRPGPFEVEREQAGEGVVGGNVLGPAVGGGDGAVERVMGVGEPARALIVEIGQRALVELRRRLDRLRQDAVGIATGASPGAAVGGTSGTMSMRSGGLSQARLRPSSFFAASAIRIARGSAA